MNNANFGIKIIGGMFMFRNLLFQMTQTIAAHEK